MLDDRSKSIITTKKIIFSTNAPHEMNKKSDFPYNYYNLHKDTWNKLVFIFFYLYLLEIEGSPIILSLFNFKKNNYTTKVKN